MPINPVQEKFMYFCRNGHENEVAKWLNENEGEIVLNAVHEQRGDTPLTAACKNGHIDVVKQLLSYPTLDVNLPAKIESYHYLAWDLALQGRHFEIVKLLVADSRLDVNKISQDASLLHQLCLRLGAESPLVILECIHLILTIHPALKIEKQGQDYDKEGNPTRHVFSLLFYKRIFPVLTLVLAYDAVIKNKIEYHEDLAFTFAQQFLPVKIASSFHKERIDAENAANLQLFKEEIFPQIIPQLSQVIKDLRDLRQNALKSYRTELFVLLDFLHKGYLQLKPDISPNIVHFYHLAQKLPNADLKMVLSNRVYGFAQEVVRDSEIAQEKPKLVQRYQKK